MASALTVLYAKYDEQFGNQLTALIPPIKPLITSQKSLTSNDAEPLLRKRPDPVIAKVSVPKAEAVGKSTPEPVKKEEPVKVPEKTKPLESNDSYNTTQIQQEVKNSFDAAISDKNGVSNSNV